jgi:hypothetical protein
MNRSAARAATKVALLSLGIVLAGGAGAQQSSLHGEFAAAAGQQSAGPARSEILADRPVWKRITLGHHRSVHTLRAALGAARMHVGDTADEILGRPAFSFSTTRMPADLVVVTLADLGFARETPLADIYRQAMQHGLQLCPAEVGPLLRLAYAEQPIGEFLRIAMQPITTWRGMPVDLTVANGAEGLLLIGGESRDDLMLAPGTKLVFARPQRRAKPDAR